MKITFNLRKFLYNKDAQWVLKELYNKRNNKKSFWIYLPLTDKRINQFFEKQYHTQDGKKLPNSYFDNPDLNLLLELEGLSILHPIKQGVSPDDNGSWMKNVKIKNKTAIKELYRWINDNAYIIHRGHFSLNKATGIAYYKDQQTRFYKNSGIYKLFKTFMERENHQIHLEEMIEIQQKQSTPNVEEENIEKATFELIKELGKKFKIKTGNLTKLFVRIDDDYLLRGKII